MKVFAVVNIRNTFETTRQRLSYLCFTHETLSPRFRASWKIKRTIFGKKFHDSIKVMPIECSKDFL